MGMQPIKVIIVEDHTLVREGTRGILEQQPDIEVVAEAERAQAALELAMQHDVDVVIADVRLPDMTGIELVRLLRQRKPEVKVLILSAYDDEEYVREALRVGANGYLLKTTPASELIEAVRAVHSGASVLQATLMRRLAAGWPGGSFSGPRLSSRESEVLHLLARGMANKEIARDLSLSLRTVEGHLNNIFAKMGVASRTEAIVQAVQRHMVNLEDPSPR